METLVHADRLAGLGAADSILQQLRAIHAALRDTHDRVDRIAVAAYDEATGSLRTLISSNDGPNPLERYECRLADAPGLEELFRARRPRVVPDMSIFDGGLARHTRKIAGEGFRSSYTLPIHRGDRFVGFVFFNSKILNAFDELLLDELDVWGHLVGSIVDHELTAAGILTGAIKTAGDFVHAHDPETFGHLQRMARYARLIASQLVDTGEAVMTDEEIERIFHFAPMHDLGKIGVPAAVLTKPSRLSEDEVEMMRRHAEIGAAMVDRLIANFDLRTIHGIDTLRQVALMHHETLDGSGYPDGLTADEIPLPARIVAVADIFDALTSPRPCKRPWSFDEAFDMLAQLAEHKIDRHCVEALVARREEALSIQRAFEEA